MTLTTFDDGLASMSLRDLVKLYLEKAYLSRFESARLIENGVRMGLSLRKPIKFDFIVENEALGEVVGIDVKDWRRSVGINVVIQFGRKVEEAGLSYGILVATEFSDVARRKPPKNVILLSKGELISILRTMRG